jgi:hypothetical protein
MQRIDFQPNNLLFSKLKAAKKGLAANLRYKIKKESEEISI